MASLYDLNSDYVRLNAMLEMAETEEDIKAINDTLEMIELDLNEKVENTAKFIKNLESDIDGFKKESKRLADWAKTRENFVKKLKDNVEMAMKAKGVDSLKVGTFSCGYRKSESVEVDNLDVLPAEFTKVSITADKTGIKKALKNGQVVDGAHLQENMNFYIK